MMKWVIGIAKKIYSLSPALYWKLPIIEVLNTDWYRRIYLKRVEEQFDVYRHGGFEEVKFEVTNKCNADCIMCPNSVMERAITYMDMDFYKKIIDEIASAKLPVKQFVFSGLGEPTLDSRLAEKIAYIKSKGNYSVKLITNGSLLVEHKSRALIDSGLDEVMFSFNGVSKENYEKVMRHMSYEKTLANILGFLKMRQNGRPYITISCVQLDANAEDIPKMEAFWRSQGVPINDFKKPIPVNRGGDSISFTSKWSLPKPGNHLWPCRSMGGTLLINSDGKVALCIMDYESRYPMGDFNKNTLKQIMRKKEEIYQQHKNKDFSATPCCLTCTIMTEQAVSWWAASESESKL